MDDQLADTVHDSADRFHLAIDVGNAAFHRGREAHTRDAREQRSAGILLAFGAKGTPTVVMSIVFAGAPIVNAIVAALMHPPKGGIAAVPWQFYLGIVMAATGGCLVSYYKPPAAPKAAKTATAPASPGVTTGH